MTGKTQRLATAALLLSLMVLSQSLRLFIPIPMLINTFLIGSLVNGCFILTFLRCGFSYALVLAIIAPVIAAMQGFLISPLLIFPVALGQIIYLSAFAYLTKLHFIKLRANIFVPAILKAGALYFLMNAVLGWLQIPLNIRQPLLLVMSWPQVITGTFGILFALWMDKKTREL